MNSEHSAEAFASLAELQEAGLERLQEEEALQGAALEPTRVEKIRHFITRAQATGAILDRSSDRKAAMATIDYWTTVLILSNANPPSVVDTPTLAPFDASLAPDLGGVASPYKGLSAFLESDASKYFGREEASLELLKEVETKSLVVVSAPSGSGKTSLLQAGLAPRLKDKLAALDGPYDLLAVVTPGRDPFQSLATALLPNSEDDQIAALAATLLKTPTRADELVRSVREKPFILIVDQFEELFSMQRSDADKVAEALAQAFVELLAHNRLVIGIREDQRRQLEKLGALGPKALAAVYTPPMLTPEQLRRVIEAPAESVGLRFDEGIVDKLVREMTGEPAALPLLQFALSKLWEHKERNRITRAVYENVGSPRLALQRAADQTFEALLLQDQDRCQRLFLKLVTPVAENEFVRCTLTREALWQGEASDGIDNVLSKFVRAGLLRRQKRARPEDDRFDVTHESLIRNWPRLAEWLKNYRTDQAAFWRIRATARQWIDSRRSRDYLLSGDDLKQAYAFGKRDSDIAALIDASEQRQKNFTALLLAGCFVVIGSVIAALKAESRVIASQYEAGTKVSIAEAQTAKAEAQAASTENSWMKMRMKAATELSEANTANIIALREALAHHDLLKFKATLKDMGVDPELLAELQLTARRLRKRRPPVSAEALREVVSNPTQQQAPKFGRAGSCDGYLWLGNKDASKVSPFPDDPSKASPKTVRIARSSLRLRESPPTIEAYEKPGKSVGVVPRNTPLRLVGNGLLFNRSVPQWWSRVQVPRQVCAHVFIQYVGNVRTASRLVTALKADAYQVAPEELVPTADGLSEVRYFYPEDAAIAETVAQQVSAELKGRMVKPKDASAWAKSQRLSPPPQGTLEVWVDLDRL